MAPKDRMVRSRFDQTSICMVKAASGVRVSMHRTEVGDACSAMENGLSSSKKPGFGNSVEHSVQIV
jgi:hypothetical protein